MVPKEATNCTTCSSFNLHYCSETPMQYLQSFRLDACDTDLLALSPILIRVSGLLQREQTISHLHVPNVEPLI
jgi:hypothetical protein